MLSTSDALGDDCPADQVRRSSRRSQVGEVLIEAANSPDGSCLVPSDPRSTLQTQFYTSVSIRCVAISEQKRLREKLLTINYFEREAIGSVERMQIHGVIRVSPQQVAWHDNLYDRAVRFPDWLEKVLCH